MLKNVPFVHLHTHTHYSLLDGLSQFDALIKKVKEFKMDAIAITDHGNMYGAIEFYKKCKKAGIKPIIGVEAYIAKRSRFDKDPNIDNKRFHLTLLAKNETGYKNLIKLVSAAQVEGYYYKPRMDHELLREHSEGLIALSGCFGGELQRALHANNLDKAREVAALYQDIFGKENYYFEIMHHPGVEGLIEVKEKTIELARELDIPLVATCDSHYIDKDDGRAHETLLAIQTNADMTDGNRFSMRQDNFNIQSGAEVAELFKNTPEAIENTVKIAEQCNLELDLGNWVFPELPLTKGKTHDEELEKLTYEGVQTRGMELTPENKERIEFELKVIRDKGYAPYFLVVSDILREAESKGIYTTIRGSVAGSIVTYLTGITKVDPMEYNLPFERFLNPYRPSAPDIDMDFADNRRDEMIEYVKEKYGEDKVAQIGTFGKMLAKGVVRDVARALGQPYALGDEISRLIPMGSQGFPMTLERAFKVEPDLKKLYDTRADVKEVIDLGRKLEGCVRHISVHAAGVVISPTAIEDFTPIQLDPKGGKKITQYDMHSVEDAGLLKFDFLGIRNLAILADAVKRVKVIRDIDIDIEKIPLDDIKTFEMLARGETMGLFQLNGTGMTGFLIDLKPSTIHDINAMVALYRPGPMNNIPEYIDRKQGKKPITYYHPKMEKFLDKSYGILVYQDDLLYTALELAGYNWESVDKFRKAVGKKIPEEMKKQHVIFVEGCMEHSGMNKKEAEGLWDLFEPFQGYGFNKAHAACYGRVAYQTAYMKANYPAEYMTAVLTAESGDIDKVAEIISECKRMGYEVMPPDVNESFSDFTVVLDDNKQVTKKIRFGLSSIKNFGEAIGAAIIDERKKNGPFKTYSDFLERVLHKNLNKKSLEALIMCGAMENFGGRGTMLAHLEDALEFNKEIGRQANAGQESLFADVDLRIEVPKFNLPKGEHAPIGEKLKWEKELLGMYISGHPLEQYKDKFENHDQTVEKVTEFAEGAAVLVAGILEEVKPLLTKKGDKMIFAKLEDFSGQIEIVVFPDTYREYTEILNTGSIVAIKGKISHRNNTASIIVERVKALDKG